MLKALVDPLSTLKMLKAQKFSQFCLRILGTGASHPNSGIYKGDNELLCRRHPLVPGMQLTVISHSLRGSICTVAHHHKLAERPGVIQIHFTLQKTYS